MALIFYLIYHDGHSQKPVSYHRIHYILHILIHLLNDIMQKVIHCNVYRLTVSKFFQFLYMAYSLMYKYFLTILEVMLISDIGLQNSIISLLSLLKNGLTNDMLSASGKMPFSMHRFIIWLRCGDIFSGIDFMTFVDRPSYPTQCVFFRPFMILNTSSGEHGLRKNQSIRFSIRLVLFLKESGIRSVLSAKQLLNALAMSVIILLSTLILLIQLLGMFNFS